jgi:signal transduction histidine kinase
MRCSDQAKGGTIRVSLRRESGNWALTVSDDGVGMDESTAAKVFDPFFTTKGPEQGSGLGLSMAQLIANQHGGALTIKTAPGQGAAFTVHLPEGFEPEGFDWQSRRHVPDISALSAETEGLDRA